MKQAAAAATGLMNVLDVRRSKTAYPTGDPSFAVMQAFPGAYSAEEADPFLMCDLFGPIQSEGAVTDPDFYPIGWHPHRGMDIMTYIVEGVGRHADSMGNRETFPSPGMQWCSTGSGIEHAEAGGTPAGQNTTGFQIWINVPSVAKMNDPAYGTEPPENLPTAALQDGGKGFSRLLAGTHNGKTGPFRTVTPVQMIDYVLEPGSGPVTHGILPTSLDSTLILCYRGAGSVNGAPMKTFDVARLDATSPDTRQVVLEASTSGACFLFFSGKKLGEPIAWRGPIVMNTEAELEVAFQELRRGTFLKKRVPWDYKRIAAFPRKQ